MQSARGEEQATLLLNTKSHYGYDLATIMVRLSYVLHEGRKAPPHCSSRHPLRVLTETETERTRRGAGIIR